MSKWLVLIIPAFLGMTTVLQSTLNKKMSEAIGLPSVMLVNAATLFILALGLFFAQKYGWIPMDWITTSNTGGPTTSGADATAHFWYLLPGLFGFAIVLGFPTAIAHIGATRVFVVVIAFQLITSLMWDHFIDSRSLGWNQWGALVLALGAAVLSNLDGL